jgi:hypothetical protein
MRRRSSRDASLRQCHGDRFVWVEGRPVPREQACGCHNLVTSRDQGTFVDHATDPVDPAGADNVVRPGHSQRAACLSRRSAGHAAAMRLGLVAIAEPVASLSQDIAKPYLGLRLGGSLRRSTRCASEFSQRPRSLSGASTVHTDRSASVAKPSAAAHCTSGTCSARSAGPARAWLAGGLAGRAARAAVRSPPLGRWRNSGSRSWQTYHLGGGLRGNDRERDRYLVDGGWVDSEPGRPKPLRQ